MAIKIKIVLDLEIEIHTCDFDVPKLNLIQRKRQIGSSHGKARLLNNLPHDSSLHGS